LVVPTLEFFVGERSIRSLHPRFVGGIISVLSNELLLFIRESYIIEAIVIHGVRFANFNRANNQRPDVVGSIPRGSTKEFELLLLLAVVTAVVAEVMEEEDDDDEVVVVVEAVDAAGVGVEAAGGLTIASRSLMIVLRLPRLKPNSFKSFSEMSTNTSRCSLE